MEFILASSSPRRRLLLETIGYNVKVCPPNVHEHSHHDTLIAKINAKKKALDVLERSNLEPGQILVSADTIVVFKNEILGKPRDLDEALATLKKLSNQRHEVITAFCLFNKQREIVERQVLSEVYFRDLTHDEIISYLRTNEYLDKAGAYGVQSAGAALIKDIKGSLTNIIGLPIEELLYEARILLRENNR